MSRRRERLNTGRTNTSRLSARVPHSPIARTPHGADTGSAGETPATGRGGDTARTRSTVRSASSHRSLARNDSSRQLSATGGSIVTGRSQPRMTQSMSRYVVALSGWALCPSNACHQLRSHDPGQRPANARVLSRCCCLLPCVHPAIQAQAIAVHANSTGHGTSAVERDTPTAQDAPNAVGDAGGA